jgi:murein L,D-transpeptidase YafK
LGSARGRRAFVTAGLAIALWHPLGVSVAAARTHEQVLAELRPRCAPRLAADARAGGVAYPPARLVLVGLKQERLLEAWAPARDGWRRLRAYPVLAASGGPGPKRREGDLQVPEGVYRLTTFNPNSSYHLSIRVDYPNDDDRRAAASEGRADLGGDIYIHGRSVSIGCLAIGDEGIEELYVLLADVGLARTRLVLAPSAAPVPRPGDPSWVRSLYSRVRRELAAVRGARPDPG